MSNNRFLETLFPLGIKRPGREPDLLPPSRAEVKNAWNFNSIPPVRLHGVVLSCAQEQLHLLWHIIIRYLYDKYSYLLHASKARVIVELPLPEMTLSCSKLKACLDARTAEFTMRIAPTSTHQVLMPWDLMWKQRYIFRIMIICGNFGIVAATALPFCSATQTELYTW